MINPGDMYEGCIDANALMDAGADDRWRCVVIPIRPVSHDEACELVGSAYRWGALNGLDVRWLCMCDTHGPIILAPQMLLDARRFRLLLRYSDCED